MKQRFINAGLNSDISNIKFFGMENDEDNNNRTTKENIRQIKNGFYGKYIKINISGNHMLSDDLNNDDKAEVLQEINNMLNTI